MCVGSFAAALLAMFSNVAALAGDMFICHRRNTLDDYGSLRVSVNSIDAQELARGLVFEIPVVSHVLRAGDFCTPGRA